jgi:hypothetical protein
MSDLITASAQFGQKSFNGCLPFRFLISIRIRQEMKKADIKTNINKSKMLDTNDDIYIHLQNCVLLIYKESLDVLKIITKIPLKVRKPFYFEKDFGE